MPVYPSERFGDPTQRLEFWDSMRSWFQERGYFLYELVDKDGKKYQHAVPTREYDEPEISFRSTPDDPFPYAFMGPKDISKASIYSGLPPYSTTNSLRGRIMYAQDTQGRHVVLNMVEGSSEEYKVLRLLKNQPRLLDPDSFPSVVPILNLLPYNDHWFLIMPRWEMSLNLLYFFPTFQIAFQHLIFLLEVGTSLFVSSVDVKLSLRSYGLVFLHELRIFHRDIFVRNFIVNHFSSLPPAFLQGNAYRVYLKSLGVLRYAIMDFDMSMVLDEKTYGANPRLPIKELLAGFGPAPYELAHAYLDADPFKFDVACLGMYFSTHFHHIIVEVPLLAPLIVRMVTPNTDKRFTASEALAFAKTILPTISSLDRVERQLRLRYPYYEIDLWAGLPQNFLAEWASHHDGLFSWSMRLKNWLLRILTSIPRSISHRLLLFTSRLQMMSARHTMA